MGDTLHNSLEEIFLSSEEVFPLELLLKQITYLLAYLFISRVARAW